MYGIDALERDACCLTRESKPALLEPENNWGCAGEAADQGFVN